MKYCSRLLKLKLTITVVDRWIPGHVIIKWTLWTGNPHLIVFCGHIITFFDPIVYPLLFSTVSFKCEYLCYFRLTWECLLLVMQSERGTYCAQRDWHNEFVLFFEIKSFI